MKEPTRIVFNGREYGGVEQMPPEVRRQYLELVGALGKDADGDGVPDIMQKPGASNVVTHESIIHNGREYKSRDELPPEARQMLEQMPESTPDETKPVLDVRTTKVLPPQVIITERCVTSEGSSAKSGFPWTLVTVLVLVVVILLFLWLTGVKLGDLWGR